MGLMYPEFGSTGSVVGETVGSGALEGEVVGLGEGLSVAVVETLGFGASVRFVFSADFGFDGEDRVTFGDGFTLATLVGDDETVGLGVTLTTSSC